MAKLLEGVVFDAVLDEIADAEELDWTRYHWEGEYLLVTIRVRKHVGPAPERRPVRAEALTDD